MDFVVCPKCKMRVLPGPDGTCPSCQRRIPDRAKKVSPAGKTRASAGNLRKRTAPARPLVFDYQEVLASAAEIVWGQKAMWILAIVFSALSTAFLVCFFYYMGGTVLANGASTLTAIQSNLGKSSTILWIIALLFGYFIVICMGLGTVTALVCIRGTYLGDRGRMSLSLGLLLRESLPHFWRLLGLLMILGLVLSAAIGGVGCIFAIPIFLLGKTATGIVSLIPGMIYFVLYYIFATPFLQQAKAALLVEETGVFAAIERGWEIIRKNFGRMLVMALILLVIALAITGLMLPLGQIGQNLKLFSSDRAALSPLNITVAVVYFIVATFAMSILQVFSDSAWTLTFLRLAGRKKSKA